MTQKIHLTLTADYVSDWAFWEAIRELIQNAIDVKDYSVTMCYESCSIVMTTREGKMKKSTLLLGETTKSGDKSAVGKYGEGYKLGCLVLLRMGYTVSIRNGKDRWHMTMEEHPILGVQCLTANIHENYFADESDNEVVFIVSGLSKDNFEEIDQKYLPHEDIEDDYFVRVSHDGNQIFTESDEEGVHIDEDVAKNVYVKGLWVCELPSDYTFSYNLQPDLIDLDRDRRSVDTWDLQKAVCMLLEDSGNFDLLVDLSEAKSTDLYAYYTPSRYKTVSSVSTGKPERVSKALGNLTRERFHAKYGKDAFPVSDSLNSDKAAIWYKRLSGMGLKPVLTAGALVRLMPEDMQVLPNMPKITLEPSEALKVFLHDNKKHMRSRAYKSLLKISEEITLKS